MERKQLFNHKSVCNNARLDLKNKYVSRVPYKLELSMAKLTADEWKNWPCVCVLHNILPKEHVDCWWLFVQTCIYNS